MDPRIYEAVREALAEGLTRDVLLIVATTVVLSVIGGYLAAFVKKKAETLATKTDVDWLKNQLAANTRLTETIKQDLTKEFSLWQARLEFKRKQVEEFYSPLLFLVQKKNWIQERLDQRLHQCADQNEEWTEILRTFYDEYMLPLQAEIAEYFKTKSFLMEEESESFNQFLRHQAEESSLYTLWRKKNIEGKSTAVEWPPEFEENIRKTKQRLEAELREFLNLPPIVRAGRAKQTCLTEHNFTHDQAALETSA
jgi:hypothetical protein